MQQNWKGLKDKTSDYKRKFKQKDCQIIPKNLSTKLMLLVLKQFCRQKRKDSQSFKVSIEVFNPKGKKSLKK